MAADSTARSESVLQGWQPIETYETEGPKCPYCGRQYTADDPVYFDEIRYTEETCDECGNTFDVEVYTSTSWTCSTRNLQSDDDTPPAPAMGGA